MLDVTPLFRVYGKWRLARLNAQNPADVQERLLLALVRQARDTRFGRDHGFDAIRSVADFRKRVPLRDYEALWSEYWEAAFPHLRGVTWPEAIPYFATSSGTTTGRSKYIPCSKAMVRANVKGGAEIVVHHLNNRPRSRLVGGRSFMLSGSSGLTEEAPGIYSGDLSAILSNNIPRLARMRYYPPRGLALIDDWEEKIRRIGPCSLDQNIRMIAANANWLLVLLDTLRPAGRARRFCEIYPDLEVVVHGGVSFAPYRKQFTELLEGSHAETREVYAASEAFIAVADRGDGEGMRILPDAGTYYEFVPVDALGPADAPRVGLAEVECGVDYAIVVTTCAGLWAYVIGDIVRFVERDPPRILVAGRTDEMLNAFGEHVSGAEVERAVTHAADAIGASVNDYTAAPVVPEAEGCLGGHVYVVEFADGPPSPERITRFADALDALILRTNEDYEDHRARGFGMHAPLVRAVASGTFAAWMKSRGKMGGQHKVPRIINDRELFDSLCAVAQRTDEIAAAD